MPTNIVTNVQLKSPHWTQRLPDAENLCKIAAEAVWETVLDDDKIFEVTIALADDTMVRELNFRYRNQNKPTNVLSFPSGVDEHTIPGDLATLGDVIVAFETVNAEAPTRVSEHLSHLVVHGCLHLLGFKHEKQEEANKMEALEVKILASLGYQNPYDLNYNFKINQAR